MTYSVGATGIRAGNFAQPVTQILSDDQATVGAQALAQQRGTHFLCKGPDGFQRYFAIDAERSVPGLPPILLPTGRN